MAETSRHTGGARVGALNATWPFASLTLSGDSLRRSCLGREHLFPRATITRLGLHRGLLSTGLRIEHRVATAPEFIVFWPDILPGTGAFRRLEAELEKLGYEVD